jgi:hypothetical protein
MKCFFLFLLLLPYSLIAQEPEANGYVALEREGYVMFSFENILDPATGDVDFKGKDIATDIILEGGKPLEYRIEIKDNETALLLQKRNNSWIVQDTLMINIDMWEFREGWPLISPFKVTDFDKDGDQDLVYTEYLGGRNDTTTAIYLNTFGNKSLVRLYDIAEESYDFVNPEYDTNKCVLKTYISGGLYSVSTTSIYKIDEGIAKPLRRIEIDHTDEVKIVESTYKGVKNKWVLENTITKK